MENNHIEYKVSLNPDLGLEKSDVAFLNAPEGGFIFVGVDNDGEAVEVNDLDGDMLKIKDRIKNNIESSVITSNEALSFGLGYEEFFEGNSLLQNKEFMRAFKDLDLVEQMGLGVRRILEHYNRECFRFTENFLRMSFPVATTMEDTTEATLEASFFKVFKGEMTRDELLMVLKLKNPKQKYRLTLKGKEARGDK